jgi:hypothetical protein
LGYDYIVIHRVLEYLGCVYMVILGVLEYLGYVATVVFGPLWYLGYLALVLFGLNGTWGNGKCAFFGVWVLGVMLNRCFK